MAVTVVDIRNPKHTQVYMCTPIKSVMAAYAQSLNDWNTWDYEKRYRHMVAVGKHSVACGDFSAIKPKVK